MKEYILVCLQRSVTCQGSGLSHEGTMALGLHAKVRKIVRGEKKTLAPFKCPGCMRMDLFYLIILHFKNKTNSKSLSLIGCNSLFYFMFYCTFV